MLKKMHHFCRRKSRLQLIIVWVIWVVMIGMLGSCTVDRVNKHRAGICAAAAGMAFEVGVFSEVK